MGRQGQWSSRSLHERQPDLALVPEGRRYRALDLHQRRRRLRSPRRRTRRRTVWSLRPRKSCRKRPQATVLPRPTVAARAVVVAAKAGAVLVARPEAVLVARAEAGVADRWTACWGWPAEGADSTRLPRAMRRRVGRSSAEFFRRDECNEVYLRASWRSRQ